MTSYIIEIQEDDSGELFIELPDELIDELHWQEGDVLNWDSERRRYCSQSRYMMRMLVTKVEEGVK
jgi:hypothetical protein